MVLRLSLIFPLLQIATAVQPFSAEATEAEAQQHDSYEQFSADLPFGRLCGSDGDRGLHLVSSSSQEGHAHGSFSCDALTFPEDPLKSCPSQSESCRTRPFLASKPSYENAYSHEIRDTVRQLPPGEPFERREYAEYSYPLGSILQLSYASRKEVPGFPSSSRVLPLGSVLPSAPLAWVLDPEMEGASAETLMPVLDSQNAQNELVAGLVCGRGGSFWLLREQWSDPAWFSWFWRWVGRESGGIRAECVERPKNAGNANDVYTDDVAEGLAEFRLPTNRELESMQKPFVYAGGSSSGTSEVTSAISAKRTPAGGAAVAKTPGGARIRDLWGGIYKHIHMPDGLDLVAESDDYDGIQSPFDKAASTRLNIDYWTVDAEGCKGPENEKTTGDHDTPDMLSTLDRAFALVERMFLCARRPGNSGFPAATVEVVSSAATSTQSAPQTEIVEVEAAASRLCVPTLGFDPEAPTSYSAPYNLTSVLASHLPEIGAKAPQRLAFGDPPHPRAVKHWIPRKHHHRSRDSTTTNTTINSPGESQSPLPGVGTMVWLETTIPHINISTKTAPIYFCGFTDSKTNTFPPSTPKETIAFFQNPQNHHIRLRHFTVCTYTSNSRLEHPVSGQRQFGVLTNSHSNKIRVFAKGCDSTSGLTTGAGWLNWFGAAVGFTVGDGVWLDWSGKMRERLLNPVGAFRCERAVGSARSAGSGAETLASVSANEPGVGIGQRQHGVLRRDVFGMGQLDDSVRDGVQADYRQLEKGGESEGRPDL